ncbi:hypothetical protein ACH42_04215 [Endozoicomonas sp. (ex Bugula neritina AB1)]|nr:hypothetical protein ACH42_04215 [Endozoicomonas sp. (ex Bugula neritina AB1)]
MQISMNELKASLRRCFEANGYFSGNFEDAADMILWLEQHGFEGVKELAKVLPYIHQDGDKPLITIAYEDQISVTIDAHHRSSLNCMAVAVDLIHTKAMKSGLVMATIKNCHNRKVVLQTLSYCGSRGISAVAYWCNGSENITEHTAMIKAGEALPSYSMATSTHAAQDGDHQSLTLICSSRVDLTSSLPAIRNYPEQYHFTPTQLASSKEKTISQGIHIDEAIWAEINRIGAGVLVENSDRSRMGAGN